MSCFLKNTVWYFLDVRYYYFLDEKYYRALQKDTYRMSNTTNFFVETSSIETFFRYGTDEKPVLVKRNSIIEGTFVVRIS